MDGATAVHGDEGAVPGSGDLTVCIYCGELMEFTEPGHAVSLTQEKLEAMEPDVQHALKTAQRYILEHHN